MKLRILSVAYPFARVGAKGILRRRFFPGFPWVSAPDAGYCRETARRRFSPRRMAEKYFALYEHLRTRAESELAICG
jgi:hypothetical protein